MKNKLMFLPLLVFVLILAVFMAGAKSGSVKNIHNSVQTHTPLYDLKIGNTKIKAEIADTPSARGAGLSHRSSMPEGKGMLFVFDQKNTPATFWMKGMEFPLDFIWIKDNKVFQIMEDAPPEPDNLPNGQYTLYTPDGLIDYVLEVNAGFVKSHNIKVGDNVALPL